VEKKQVTMNSDLAGLQPESPAGCAIQDVPDPVFEEKAEELYALGKIHGTMHLSIGQEASAVGACLALQSDDYILSTHRGHGHSIAKGADLFLMMAEFFGKESGYCRGRGGSMHIADVEGGNLGANGVVGGGLPVSIGVGLSIKMAAQ
jgi:acetoin:2,6-dichlorophenolindophenol oxidoreductase subunit alpha